MFECKDWKAEVERICGSALTDSQKCVLASWLSRCEIGSENTRKGTLNYFLCIVDYLCESKTITEAMRLELHDYGCAVCYKTI